MESTSQVPTTKRPSMHRKIRYPSVHQVRAHWGIRAYVVPVDLVLLLLEYVGRLAKSTRDKFANEKATRVSRR